MPGRYESSARTHWPDAPQAAVIAGIYSDTSEATRAMRAHVGLAPGYPWPEHTRMLGVGGAAQDGIAVVLGLFGSEDDARRAAPKGTRFVSLQSPHDARARRTSLGTEPIVYAIDPGAAVPAYAPQDLHGPSEDPRDDAIVLDWAPSPEGVVRAEEHLAKLEPRCHVAPATVVALLTEEEQRAYLEFGWALVPAHCPDGSLAYVPRTRTRADAIVVDTAEGTFLYQVLLVECDCPAFGRWQLDATGRRTAYLGTVGPHCREEAEDELSEGK